MDVQALIGEVAKRHNVLVDPTDPIFVTVTLNELLLAEHVRQLEAAVQQAGRAALAGSAQQVEQARQVASLLVADGAKYASDQVRAAGAGLRAQLERLVQDSVQLAQTASREAERSRRLSTWTAAVALISAVAAVGSTAALWLRGP
jgi:hypothetical protein